MEWKNMVPFQEQPQYQQNQECMYWLNFQGMNDWQLVECLPTREMKDKGIDLAYTEVLVNKMSKQVESGKIGAFSTNDGRYPEGYFLVEWCDKPHVLQEDFDCND
jgi:hypothetical protein